MVQMNLLAKLFLILNVEHTEKRRKQEGREKGRDALQISAHTSLNRKHISHTLKLGIIHSN